MTLEIVTMAGLWAVAGIFLIRFGSVRSPRGIAIAVVGLIGITGTLHHWYFARRVPVTLLPRSITESRPWLYALDFKVNVEGPLRRRLAKRWTSSDRTDYITLTRDGRVTGTIQGLDPTGNGFFQTDPMAFFSEFQDGSDTYWLTVQAMDNDFRRLLPPNRVKVSLGKENPEGWTAKLLHESEYTR